MSKLFGHKLEPSFSLWRFEQKLFCTGTATKIEGRKQMGQGKYGLVVLKQCKVLCRSIIYMRHQNAKDFTTAHRWLWYMGCSCHTYRRTNLNWIVLCRIKLCVPSRKLQLLLVITGRLRPSFSARWLVSATSAHLSQFSLYSQRTTWVCPSTLHWVLQLFTIIHNHEDSKSSDRSEMEEDTPSLRSIEPANISHEEWHGMGHQQV